MLLCSNSSHWPGCVPWPCHSFLGQETPEVCQHYVHAPRNIQIEFEASEEPTYDAITVSWNPSQYGNEDTTYLSIYPFDSLSNFLFIYCSIYLAFCLVLSVSQSFFLSLCLSIILSL